MYSRLYIADDANIRQVDIYRPCRACAALGPNGTIKTVTGGGSSFGINEQFAACTAASSSGTPYVDCSESPIVAGSTSLAGVIYMAHIKRSGALLVVQVSGFA
jgi:hypothetical protein